MKIFRLTIFIATLIVYGQASKKNKVSQAEVKNCLEKSNDINTSCDFIKCFHERYNCNEESVTAWAYELCQQFPADIVLQFTPQGQKMMINIQKCTTNFLVQTFRQRKSIHCAGFEQKYFNNMAHCYSHEKDFCDVFRDNRAIFMKQATAVMMKKPRALQAFAIAAKNCTRIN